MGDFARGREPKEEEYSQHNVIYVSKADKNLSVNQDPIRSSLMDGATGGGNGFSRWITSEFQDGPFCMAILGAHVVEFSSRPLHKSLLQSGT